MKKALKEFVVVTLTKSLVVVIVVMHVKDGLDSFSGNQKIEW